MRVEVRCEKDIVELAIAGAMDVESAHEVEEVVLELLGKGQRFFALNFSQLEYMDSYGLGKLISLLRKIAAEGGAGVLHSVPENIMNIFELTRLHLVLEIFGEGGEARCKLSKLSRKS